MWFVHVMFNFNSIQSVFMSSDCWICYRLIVRFGFKEMLSVCKDVRVGVLSWEFWCCEKWIGRETLIWWQEVMHDQVRTVTFVTSWLLQVGSFMLISLRSLRFFLGEGWCDKCDDIIYHYPLSFVTVFTLSVNSDDQSDFEKISIICSWLRFVWLFVWLCSCNVHSLW